MDLLTATLWMPLKEQTSRTYFKRLQYDGELIDLFLDNGVTLNFKKVYSFRYSDETIYFKYFSYIEMLRKEKINYLGWKMEQNGIYTYLLLLDDDWIEIECGERAVKNLISISC